MVDATGKFGGKTKAKERTNGYIKSQCCADTKHSPKTSCQVQVFHMTTNLADKPSVCSMHISAVKSSEANFYIATFAAFISL